LKIQPRRIEVRKVKYEEVRKEFSTMSTSHIEIIQEESNMNEEGQPPPRRTLVKSYVAVKLEDPVSHKSWVVNGQRSKPYLGGKIERIITVVLLWEL